MPKEISSGWEILICLPLPVTKCGMCHPLCVLSVEIPKFTSFCMYDLYVCVCAHMLPYVNVCVYCFLFLGASRTYATCTKTNTLQFVLCTSH
jgi:hypothetical protein